MGLTKFVEKVHRAADICSIPTADIEITEPGDYIAGVPAIKGIESKLNQAFDELCMLRDLHLPVDKKVYLSK